MAGRVRYARSGIASLITSLPDSATRVFSAVFTIRQAERPSSVMSRPNSRVQVTPLARPVNRGVFHVRPVPTSVPISMPASGAPDADRWAVLKRKAVVEQLRS